jgi:repressor LexA
MTVRRLLPTRRQKEILEAARALAAETGRAPTLLEIARRCGLASVSTVHKHLEHLKARGLIRRRASGRRRGMEILPDAQRRAAVSVPLLGRIAAGRPIEAIGDEKSISLPRDLARGTRAYVLEVRGDSMVEEQILDGDLVVVEERARPREGEIVVALIDGREATLKTYRRHRGFVRLSPAHPTMKPIDVRPESLQIQGVATGLVRKYA